MGQIIIKGIREPLNISNDKAKIYQDKWASGTLDDLMRVGGMQFESKDIKTIIVDTQMRNVQQEDTSKEYTEAKESWKKWDSQSTDDKIKWWFKYIFMTHWALRDRQGIDYESFKRRVGKKKMKEIYEWMKEWYSHEQDTRYPSYEEYQHFLPFTAETAVDGWKTIGEAKAVKNIY